MVVILVMDREFTKLPSGKLPSAPGTDPGKHLEGSLPIGLLSLFPVAESFGNGRGLVLIGSCICRRHASTPDLTVIAKGEGLNLDLSQPNKPLFYRGFRPHMAVRQFFDRCTFVKRLRQHGIFLLTPRHAGLFRKCFSPFLFFSNPFQRANGFE
jgi:hypothetical protein